MAKRMFSRTVPRPSDILIGCNVDPQFPQADSYPAVAVLTLHVCPGGSLLRMHLLLVSMIAVAFSPGFADEGGRLGDDVQPHPELTEPEVYGARRQRAARRKCSSSKPQNAMARENYGFAVQMYRVSASWAHKPAQYNLGVMLLQRRRACRWTAHLGMAWLALAAERDEDKDYACGARPRLQPDEPDEFDRANALWRDMRKTYGDDVPLKRATNRWIQVRRSGDRIASGRGNGTSCCRGGRDVSGMNVNGQFKGEYLDAIRVRHHRPGAVDGSIAYSRLRSSDNPYGREIKRADRNRDREGHHPDWRRRAAVRPKRTRNISTDARIAAVRPPPMTAARVIRTGVPAKRLGGRQAGWIVYRRLAKSVTQPTHCDAGAADTKWMSDPLKTRRYAPSLATNPAPRWRALRAGRLRSMRLGLLSLGGFFVSFMSGNSTRLAHGCGGRFTIGFAGSIPYCSVVTGVAAGTRVATATAARSRCAVLTLVAALLLAACLVAACGYVTASVLLAAVAMGAENAVFLRDGGLPVGLTYMTGTLVALRSGTRRRKPTANAARGMPTRGTGWRWVAGATAGGPCSIEPRDCRRYGSQPWRRRCWHGRSGKCGRLGSERAAQ